ncbi:MAG: alcohol dehydrogenase [Acidimicrobiaceae bacterium]|nr:alcohol dehydrogenase [Acidimicrobiaceae bacterium]
MQAVVIDAPGSLSYGELPDPTPKPGEVVVAVRACGICGTDLHLLDGDLTTGRYPVVPGHEFSGEIVALGAGVSELKVGTLVAVDPSLYCGHCSQCRIGHDNLCENWNAIGVTVNGAAAEYVAVPQWNAYRVPEGLDASLAALIEPLSCAVHGYDLIHTKLADRFLIYGAGTMGLLLLMLAYRAGAISVTMVEPIAARRDKARALGATRVVASGADLEPEARFEIVMDATGVVAAIEDAIGRVRRGGTFLQFGVAPGDAFASMSPFKLYNDEVTMVGAMAVLHSYGRSRDLTVAGDMPLSELVSDRLPLSSYEEAVARVRRGSGYKVQVLPGDASSGGREAAVAKSASS